MRRVYTDERFPGCEIVNDGSLVFEVYCHGELLQSFETWETAEQGSQRPASERVSEPFAARRAQDYFDRWAKMALSDEVEAQDLPAAEEPAGEEVVAPQQDITRSIDSLMAKERLETNPERKETLRRRIMQMMRQEGSVAVAVVNELIS